MTRAISMLWINVALSMTVVAGSQCSAKDMPMSATDLPAGFKFGGPNVIIMNEAMDEFAKENPHATNATFIKYFKETALPTALQKHGLEKADFVLVDFYADWCGHCQQLAGYGPPPPAKPYAPMDPRFPVDPTTSNLERVAQQLLKSKNASRYAVVSLSLSALSAQKPYQQAFYNHYTLTGFPTQMILAKSVEFNQTTKAQWDCPPAQPTGNAPPVGPPVADCIQVQRLYFEPEPYPAGDLIFDGGFSFWENWRDVCRWFASGVADGAGISCADVADSVIV